MNEYGNMFDNQYKSFIAVNFIQSISKVNFKNVELDKSISSIMTKL